MMTVIAPALLDDGLFALLTASCCCCCAILPVSLVAAESAAVASAQQSVQASAEKLVTVVTRRGETLTGVVTDRHVYHLTLQFYHDGEPMGSRNIRFDAIAEERTPTAEEIAASGFPVTTLAMGKQSLGPMTRAIRHRSWRGWRRTNLQLMRCRRIIGS